MEAFRKFIERYTTLTSNEWMTIQQEFTRKEISKKELILEENKVCRSFSFIESGLLRYFYYEDGQDITKTFTIPPFCFTSRISFRNQTPAKENIQALEDSIIWQTSYKQYRELEKLNCWNTFISKLLNEIDEFTELMMRQSKTMTQEERFQYITNNYPQCILQRIPQKYMATFLGIAPQSLSRIKKSLHQKRRS
jgi:CRP-like cAMP-binding protein